MNRKQPIRTYERKKKVRNTKTFYQPILDDVVKRNNAATSIVSKVGSDTDNSLNIDPFETTFDRIAKNARMPIPLIEDGEDKSWLCSSYETSNLKTDHKSLSGVTVNLSDVYVEPIPKRQKQAKKKQKMLVAKGKLAKSNKPMQRNNKSSRKQSNISLPKRKRKRRQVDQLCKLENQENKMPFRSIERSLLPLNTSENISSSTQDHRHVFKAEKNNINAMEISVNAQNCIVPKRITELINGVNIKSCSIILNNISLGQYKQNISEINSLKCSTNSKECTVTVERLDINFKGKTPVSNSKFKKIISSTPIARMQETSSQLISLSPIRMNCSKKLDTSTSSFSQESDISVNSEIHTQKTNTSNALSDQYYNNERTRQLFTSHSLIDRSQHNLINTQTHCTNNEVQLTMALKQKQTNLHFSIASDKSRSLFDDTDLHNCNSVSESTKSQQTLESKQHYISMVSTATDPVQSFKDCHTGEISTVKIKVEQLLNSIQCDVELKTNDKQIEEENNNNNFEDVKSSSDEFSCSTQNLTSFNKTSRNSNDMDPFILLTRLQNPIAVTHRRKLNCKRDFQLTDIFEDSNSYDESLKMNQKNEKRSKKINMKKTKLSDVLNKQTNDIVSNINLLHKSVTTLHQEDPIYLKSGKSWARSLSILNNIKKESDLDELSVGKGKKWRHSVRDILDMQKQGVIQSCVKSNKTEWTLRSSSAAVTDPENALINDKNNAYGPTSASHLSRRISIRVVPNRKSVECIQDTSFLQAYGIIPKRSVDFKLLRSRKTSELTAKEVILQRCVQDDYMPFYEHFTDSYLSYCRKIGEGVYGEVFLYEIENRKSVIKVIPIEGDEQVNGEPQKKFDEILSEIVIAKELHNLRYNTENNTDKFVEVKNIKCIIGRYPEKLIELWKEYDEEKKSDNDCPAMFNENQLYIILELGHGGQDLEAFIFNTAQEAYAIFVQTALALAVAERGMEFEHRDLHWGNVLVSQTEETYVSYTLENKQITVPSYGVKVSIIDFTLSRMSYQGCCIFNDLALDPALFTAQGDYQFEIYRLMKDKVRNDWQTFEPYTNILWLHYTLDKMITAVRYRKKTLKVHKSAMVKLEDFKMKILSYKSSFDFVTNCDSFTNIQCSRPKTRLKR